jgi:hypothetical protein
VLLAVPAAAGAAPATASAAAAQSCHYTLDHQVTRPVVMAELHSWVGVDATFDYHAGSSVDSYIGAAVQGSNGIWSAHGSDHVANATDFGQSAKQSGRGDHPVTGAFKFNIVKRVGRNCPKGTVKAYTRAVRFEGSMRVRKRWPAARGLSGRCNQVKHRRRLFPGTAVHTGMSRTHTYDHAFTLVGVTLGGSTSFSTGVEVTLANHGARPVWICGVSSSGQNVPIAEAATIYAGPRARR